MNPAKLVKAVLKVLNTFTGSRIKMDSSVSELIDPGVVSAYAERHMKAPGTAVVLFLDNYGAGPSRLCWAPIWIDGLTMELGPIMEAQEMGETLKGWTIQAAMEALEKDLKDGSKGK